MLLMFSVMLQLLLPLLLLPSPSFYVFFSLALTTVMKIGVQTTISTTTIIIIIIVIIIISIFRPLCSNSVVLNLFE